MVLDEECADIAEGLGLYIALNEFPEAGAAVDIRTTPFCLCTTEESKAHSLLLFLASTVNCAHHGQETFHTILKIGRRCNAAAGVVQNRCQPKPCQKPRR
jgi:hypothetical protein